jgi:hypothetical protein
VSASLVIRQLGPSGILSRRRSRTHSQARARITSTLSWASGVTPAPSRARTARSSSTRRPGRLPLIRRRADRLPFSRRRRRTGGAVVTAEIPGNARPRDRRAWASTMLSRNAPLLYVQQQGGWRSASGLLRTHAKWMPQPAATQAQPAVPIAPVSSARNAG